MKARAWLLGASALTLAWFNTAFAQSTQPPSSKDDSAMLETVVVTAERRSENLMTTPISADVLTTSDLSAKNVVRVEDLQFIAPQVTVDNFGQGIDFNIRGIGKGEHNTQTMTGVITYRDGTPTFPGYITEEPYFDIASVEILRGPQGTFVGQNATGGAVFVTSNSPQIGGGFDGYGQLQVGNYANLALQGAVNLPISSTLAARVAVDLERRDSFYSVTNGGVKYPASMNDLNWIASRFSLLWQPTDRLSFLWKTDVDYLDNGGYPASPYTEGFKTIQAWPGVSPADVGKPNPHYSDILHFTANYPNTGMDRFVRSILKTEYEFPGGIKFRSVSAYSLGNTNYRTDLDGTDYGSQASATNEVNGVFWDRVDESMWTQEINLISPDNQRITWVIGAFAQSDRYNWIKPYQFVIDAPAGNNPSGNPANQYMLQGSTPNQSWAVFGQVVAKLPFGFEAQLGGRWSTNMSKNDVDILQYGLPLVANQKTKSYSLDYKAALSWTINDNQFLYGFVATGYKPGGLNVPVGTTPPYSTPSAFGPERVMNYEAGWKANWLDGHLRTQIDGYYNDFDNFQVTIGYPTYPSFGYEVNNPNTSRLYGMEFETQGSFGAFSFTGGLGWSHSELGLFWATDTRAPLYTTPYGPLALPCDSKLGPQPPSYWAWGNTTCINLKGHPQSYAPNFSANFSMQYAFDLGDGDKLTPRMNYGYVGPQWATLFDNPTYGDRLGVRNLLGAQIEWSHGDYVLTLYGTNLTDLHYETALNSNLRFAGPPPPCACRWLKVG